MEVPVSDASPFFSIWTQPSSYWIFVQGQAGKRLKGFNPVPGHAALFSQQTNANWQPAWDAAAEALSGHMLGTRVAVLASAEQPPLVEIVRALRPIADMHAVADNLWLIHDINAGRLDCYMQRVVDRRGKQVGYEAFARMESSDGGVIGGGAIMQAARALNNEFQIDKLLHRQAIDRFVARDLEGYLFVNFLTGFIQRPEVYFEGLSDAVQRGHLRPNCVVLDLPVSSFGRDMTKLKSIVEYCRSKGFALALDDVSAPEMLPPMLNVVQPNFIKLDPSFGHGLSPARLSAALQEIIRLAHGMGASVLAEGVETQAMHATYFEAGVDLFQGYLIGAPARYDLSFANLA